MLNRNFIFLLLAVGCAKVPEHDKANTTVSVEIIPNEVEVGEWPSENWWESFDDPTLTELIETALVLSPTLKKAEERLKASKQIALQRRGILFPEVDIDGNDNWEHLSKNGFFRAFAPMIPAAVNDLTLGLSFDYEFDFWGKNRSLFSAALREADAMAAEKKQAELILTTSIAYTYAEIQFLLRKTRIYDQMLENRLKIEKITHAREINGIDSSIERLRSHFNTLDIQTSLVAVKQQLFQDFHQIKALAGLSQKAEIEWSYKPLPVTALTLPENLEIDLIARRPDLIAQKARLEATAKEIHAAKTDFYPNINLNAFLGFETVFGSLFKAENYDGSLNPALHLPLFTAGRLTAQLKGKVAGFNEAVYAYNELILQVAREISDRITDIELLDEQIELRRKSFHTTGEEVGVNHHRLKNAINDQISVLDSQNSSLESELALADIEYARQLASILLIRALGGGYHD